MILEEDKYDIVVATDGEEGIRVARAERPDLVLLDVMMPRMSGFDVLRALRADDDLRDTPSSWSRPAAKCRCHEGYESGCNEYITKPIDRAELLMKVRSYLQTATAAL